MDRGQDGDHGKHWYRVATSNAPLICNYRFPVVVSSPLTAQGAVVAAAPGVCAPVEPRHDEQETR